MKKHVLLRKVGVLSITLLLIGLIVLKIGASSRGTQLEDDTRSASSFNFSKIRNILSRFNFIREMTDSFHGNQESRKQGHMDRTQLLKVVKQALFEIDIHDETSSSSRAIENLKIGLNSDDNEVKETAAATVFSILVDVAHDKVSSENQKSRFRTLFVTLKNANTELLQQIRQSNPQSMSIQYLDQI